MPHSNNHGDNDLDLSQEYFINEELSWEAGDDSLRDEDLMNLSIDELERRTNDHMKNSVEELKKGCRMLRILEEKRIEEETKKLMRSIGLNAIVMSHQSPGLVINDEDEILALDLSVSANSRTDLAFSHTSQILEFNPPSLIERLFFLGYIEAPDLRYKREIIYPRMKELSLNSDEIMMWLTTEELDDYKENKRKMEEYALTDEICEKVQGLEELLTKRYIERYNLLDSVSFNDIIPCEKIDLLIEHLDELKNKHIDHELIRTEVIIGMVYPGERELRFSTANNINEDPPKNRKYNRFSKLRKWNKR